jgi:multidrug efflux system outer membrane protein
MALPRRENLQLARSTMDAQQASYALVKKRYDIGVTTELDLNRPDPAGYGSA